MDEFNATTCKPGEHTAITESVAKIVRRAAIDAGKRVSLIAFDPARDVYAWNVYA